MIVRELIKELKKYDQNLRVVNLAFFDDVEISEISQWDENGNNEETMLGIG